LSEETAALEASKSRVADTEAGATELQMKLTEMRRTVDERDEQLQSLHDELAAVCVRVIYGIFGLANPYLARNKCILTVSETVNSVWIQNKIRIQWNQLQSGFSCETGVMWH